ncbi:MAG TPA: cation diffusion facilitator family transporter [Patescibacteria group bacterium]|nr:cation diffusion facilitator family transporter [Patescibacteria group bacterium]
MHNHTELESSKNLILSIIINVFIVIFEIIFGLLTRSLALISDGLHNITDIGSMALSFWGEKISNRPSNNYKTFGYKRSEAIIAFTNGGILLAVTVFILFEAVKRLINPVEVVGLQMVIVASVAFVGNGLATYLLEKSAHNNLNLKSAWLHSFQDAVFSLAVIIGAILIYFTHIVWLDSVLSIIISLFLLKEIYKIVVESIDMLLDSVPKDIDFQETKKTMSTISGVVSVNDLHIWQTGTDYRFLSAHIQTKELDEKGRINLLVTIQKILKEKYKINHSTLQTVSQKEMVIGEMTCEHCN